MKILLTDIAPLSNSTATDDTGLLILACVAIAFIAAVVVTIISNSRAKRAAQRTANVTSIMRHALDLGGVCVVKFDMRHLHVRNTFGELLPKDGVAYTQFLQRIHPEDRPAFDKFVTRICRDLGGTDEMMLRCRARAPSGGTYTSAALPRDVRCR